MTLTVIIALAGLTLLLFGAEYVLRAATALAHRVGVPPMVVGLTVVSVGTSMPELAVGIGAARQGNPGIAVGNIVGTNLVNLLLILGLSALIAPIALQRLTLKRDLPLMALAALALWLCARDGFLSVREGVLLLAVAFVYTLLVLNGARASPPSAGTPEPHQKQRPAAFHMLVLMLGLAVITFGADLLVDGSVEIARALDVSDTIIGLTVVAIGTSAPELVTAMVSTVRGNRDVAIGNLIGSSIYNIGLVLGITTLAAPPGLDISGEALGTDLFLMLAVAMICIPVFWSGRRISRLEGGIGVLLYLGYLAWMVTQAVV